jgi:hypothetical protein
MELGIDLKANSENPLTRPLLMAMNILHEEGSRVYIMKRADMIVPKLKMSVTLHYPTGLRIAQPLTYQLKGNRNIDVDVRGLMQFETHWESWDSNGRKF